MQTASKFLLWLFFFAVTMFIRPVVAASQEHDGDSFVPVSYCQLVSNPSAYAGKVVRVRAVYAYTFEVENLRPAECCSGSDGGIWVDFAELDHNSEREAKSFPDGTGLVLATFTGRFATSGPYGHMGYQFKIAVHRISDIEHSGSFRKKRPKWFPQCGS